MSNKHKTTYVEALKQHMSNGQQLVRAEKRIVLLCFYLCYYSYLILFFCLEPKGGNWNNGYSTLKSATITIENPVEWLLDSSVIKPAYKTNDQTHAQSVLLLICCHRFLCIIMGSYWLSSAHANLSWTLNPINQFKNT